MSRSTLTPQTSLPFSAVESKFLIGLTFRLALRDIIYSSQERNKQRVLHHPIHNFRRNPVYQEILQFSYQVISTSCDSLLCDQKSGRTDCGGVDKSRRLADV